MGIQLTGVGYGNGFSNYQTSKISTVSTEEVQKQDLLRKQQEVLETTSAKVDNTPQIAQNSVGDSPRKNASLEDISIGFHKKDSLDYLGKSSEIENLDVKKAISDMKKDQVLQQYQFFVGSKDDIYNGQDGKVVAK